MDSQVQEVKNRIDIAEFIKGHVRLEKAGINFKGLCPFHNEKTPSFFVSPARQTWHCFGCSRGGDVFQFVQELEGVEFVDALRALAERAGVVLKREDPKLRSARSRLYDICEAACAFYETHLTPESAPYRYLFERGLTPETIKSFRLGFARGEWRDLLQALAQKGYSAGELEQAGLVVRSTGKTYDRFRNRILFPIFDLTGKVVGFSGRIFETGGDAAPSAKYVNTTNTLIYDKSRVLYGLDRARQAIRSKDAALLVEGQMDLLMAHQAGTAYAVATSGTALTPAHLALLKRYTTNLITAFDMDTAGSEATKRSIDLARREGFDVKVAVLPQGKDPAELIQREQAQWEETLQAVRPVMEYYVEAALARYDIAGIEGKKRFAAELLPEVKRIKDPIERAQWVARLAGKLGVQERVVEEALKQTPFRDDGNEATAEAAESIVAKEGKNDRMTMLGERLLGLLLAYPQYRMALTEVPNLFEGRSVKLAAVFDAVKANKTSFTEDVAQFAGTLQLRVEAFPLPDADIEKEVRVCIQQLKARHLQEELHRLGQAIKSIEANKSVGEELKVLSAEFQTKTRELNEITNNRTP